MLEYIIDSCGSTAAMQKTLNTSVLGLWSQPSKQDAAKDEGTKPFVWNEPENSSGESKFPTRTQGCNGRKLTSHEMFTQEIEKHVALWCKVDRIQNDKFYDPLMYTFKCFWGDFYIFYNI